MVETIRGETLRPAEMQPDPGVGQHRQPLHHLLVERPEMVPVLGQPGELGVFRDAAGRPRVTARLEEAHHQPGALVLHVGVLGRGLDRGQPGGEAADRLGHDVVVGQGLQRDADAVPGAELPAPHPGRVDHVLGLDGPVRGRHAGDPPVLLGHPSDQHVLQDLPAQLTDAAGQRHRRVGGVAPAVVRVVHRARQVPGVQQGEQLDGLAGRDGLGPDPVGVGGRGLPAQFLPPGRTVGQVQGPGALEPGGETRVTLQRGEDVQAALDDLPGARGGPGLGDEPGRVPGRAGGQPAAFHDDDVGPAPPGQVVGGAAASDATTDHDHPGGVR